MMCIVLLKRWQVLYTKCLTYKLKKVAKTLKHPRGKSLLCFLENTGRVFYSMSPDKFTFAEAEQQCQKLGAQLATTGQLYLGLEGGHGCVQCRLAGRPECSLPHQHRPAPVWRWTSWRAHGVSLPKSNRLPPPGLPL